VIGPAFVGQLPSNSRALRSLAHDLPQVCPYCLHHHRHRKSFEIACRVFSYNLLRIEVTFVSTRPLPAMKGEP
jgi:hypothetical protein